MHLLIFEDKTSINKTHQVIKCNQIIINCHIVYAINYCNNCYYLSKKVSFNIVDSFLLENLIPIIKFFEP